jgi:hypothetical protein
MKKPIPQKAMAPTVSAVGAIRKNQKHLKFSAKSTASEAQLDRLLMLLRLRPHHTHELRSKGISHPAGRVLNLIKRGYLIGSGRIATVDSDGFEHVGVALYSLVSEPEAT